MVAGTPSGLTVKVFVGFEFECIRGHRFMAAAADKAMRVTSNAVLPRDAAARIVAADMPLYMPCPCRSQRALTAQLMRVHVVTPKAPLNVTLRPFVQPCPEGPVFHTANTGAIKLPPNTYWVLRLPYIYCGKRSEMQKNQEFRCTFNLQNCFAGDGGAHLPPKEPPGLSYGRILRGILAVAED